MRFLDKFTTVLFCLLVITIMVTTYAVDVPSVHAGYPYFSTSVNVTSPKPPEVRKYTPGQAMQFSGQFGWAYCGNAGNFRVYGRMSRPVPVGQEHAAFGSWTEIASAVGRKTYTNTFTAPTRPGVYKFRYQLEFGSPCLTARGISCGGTSNVRFMSAMVQSVRTPRVSVLPTPIGNVNTYRRTGTVTFEVKDPTPPPDDCPANQIPVMQNGRQVCLPETLTLQCTSTATSVNAGDEVSFAAETNTSATFTWYAGVGTGGAVLGGPETGTRSILPRTFNTPGQYQVTAFAQNSSGVGMCTRGVFVAGEEEEVEEEEVFDEFGNVVHQDGTRTAPDGTVLTFNPAAGPTSITFTLDPTLTNTTCGATWVAQNASACYLVQYDNRATAVAVDTAGTQQVLPATYHVECLASSNGSIVSSEQRICRQNLNLREE